MPGKLLAGGTWKTSMRRSDSGNGSARSSAALTTLKIAVFAPIPKAITKMATAAKLLLLRKTRRLIRICCSRLCISSSLVAQRNHGFHFGGTAGRHVTGANGRDQQDRGDRHKGADVDGSDAVKNVA